MVEAPDWIEAASASALSKSNLLSLNHDLRAFALVGGYMGYFALLEDGVNRALAEILGVGGLRRAIISRSMGFDDKLKSLRALILASVEDEDGDGIFELQDNHPRGGDPVKYRFVDGMLSLAP